MSGREAAVAPEPVPGRAPRPGRAPALSRASLLALLAALLLAPGTARAQESSGGAGADRSRPPAGPRFTATGFVGVLAPLARLTTDPESFETEISTSGLFGAEVAWWPWRRLGLAAQGAWAPAQLNLVATDFTGALPEDLGDADYLTGSLEARYRVPLPPEVSLVRPYLALGGGVRRLQVDSIASPEVSDATDPMATAAAGAHVEFAGRAELRIELRDRVTLYRSPTSGENRLQNDVGISVGMAFAAP